MIQKRSVPNILTYARIVAIPLFILVFLEGYAAAALAVFILASTTDFFDGYFARKWNVVSKFGAMLDQIGDKLLVCAVLLCLLSTQQAELIPVIIIIFREILVSGLREFMGNEGIEMPVSKLGKWKTTAQLVAITALLAAPVAGQYYLVQFGDAMLWVAAILSAITAKDYALTATKAL